MEVVFDSTGKQIQKTLDVIQLGLLGMGIVPGYEYNYESGTADSRKNKDNSYIKYIGGRFNIQFRATPKYSYTIFSILIFDINNILNKEDISGYIEGDYGLYNLSFEETTENNVHVFKQNLYIKYSEGYFTTVSKSGTISIKNIPFIDFSLYSGTSA